MKHYKIEATEEQRANLNKLANFLEGFENNDDIEGGFSMATFNLESRYKATEEHSCNTVACAVGWGPTAGIPITKGESWLEYSENFMSNETFHDTWDWLFSGDWCGKDDTALGAAKRIKYTLEHGQPENWEGQMIGDDDLCYEDS